MSRPCNLEPPACQGVPVHAWQTGGALPDEAEPGLWLAAGGEHQQVARLGAGNVVQAGTIEVPDASGLFARIDVAFSVRLWPTRSVSKFGPLIEPTTSRSLLLA